MIRLPLLLVVLMVCSLTSLAQTQSDLNALLARLSGQSEHITKNISVLKFVSKGKELLPVLCGKFTDSTKSLVFSKCANRLLTRGEIAIIIADRIESMPYFLLTGLQNCTMDMCKDNPNVVEYYLDFIKLRGMTATFQKRYIDWLKSKERKSRIKA